MKPHNIPIREYIVKGLIDELQFPEKTIDIVIVHQFESAIEAFKSNNSVEISRFGKFVFNEKKAIKKLQDYDRILDRLEAKLKQNVSISEIQEIENKINSIKISVELLKQKVYGS